MNINRIRNAKGFTLIELMIATSLLMAVLFAGYYGFSLYSQKWQKRVNIFWQSTEQVMALDAINKMLVSTVLYTVKDEQNKQCIYFSGDSKTLRFVTHAPIFSSGTALVELALEANNEQTYQLIYKERSLVNAPLFTLADFDQQTSPIMWQKKSILLSHVQEFNWSFYGPVSFADALSRYSATNNNTISDTRVWYSQHMANKIRITPEYVKLTMTTAGSNSSRGLFTEILISMPNQPVFAVLNNIQGWE